jgi:hypothetical protein
MPCERMRLYVALMRCPASLRLSIASSRRVSSLAMTDVYGHAAFSDHPIGAVKRVTSGRWWELIQNSSHAASVEDARRSPCKAESCTTAAGFLHTGSVPLPEAFARVERHPRGCAMRTRESE